MKKFLLALLTTLFVSAMPLQAAYALADDANSKEACTVSYKDILPPEALDLLKANNGSLVELEGIQARAFQSRVEDLVGQKAPFTSTKIVIVHPNDEDDTIYNIAFVVNDCVMTILHLPPAVVDALLSPLETKPGERVD